MLCQVPHWRSLENAGNRFTHQLRACQLLPAYCSPLEAAQAAVAEPPQVAPTCTISGVSLLWQAEPAGTSEPWISGGDSGFDLLSAAAGAFAEHSGGPRDLATR
jgi:hypothetical protein